MPEYLVQHYVDNSQRIHPNNLAVSSSGRGMTYRGLFEASNRIANTLIRIGVRRQDRIVLCLGRSPMNIVGIVAAVKTDGIYVPIEPRAPAERFLKIIADCNPSAMISDGPTAARLAEQGLIPDDMRLVIVGNGWEAARRTGCCTVTQQEIDSQSSDPPNYRNVDTDIAYILYTSGSTGSPKGVMVSHLNITNYINWAVETFDISSTDVVLGTAPFHFDMSTFDIYCPLKAGAALAVATEELLLFPNRLVRFIEEKGVTLWKGISSLLMYMARTGCLKPGAMPTLKRVIFSGEVLSTKYLIQWMQCYPEKMFYNGYGPTEATGMSMFHAVPNVPSDPGAIIPLGRACGNTEVLLLDEKSAPVQTGEIGELCIRGSGVSRGYWNDPKKTSLAFVPNPAAGLNSDVLYRTGDLARQREDGIYEFVGRRDSQIKWMGYRIELGEIENAVRSLDRVRDAAVLFHNGHQIGDQGMVAFVEVEGSLGSDKIIAELRRRLPEYMMPRHVIPLADLPRTDRGKIDRVKLRESLERSNSPVEDVAAATGLR